MSIILYNYSSNLSVSLIKENEPKESDWKCFRVPVKFLSHFCEKLIDFCSQDGADAECLLHRANVVVLPVALGGLLFTDGHASPVDTHDGDRIDIVLLKGYV